MRPPAAGAGISPAFARRVAEALLAEAAHFEVILEALKNESPAVRTHAVLVTSALVSESRERVDVALLACRGAMSRLVEVLDDESEDVVAEAMLLLRQLTASNAEVRNLVAFQVRARAER